VLEIEVAGQRLQLLAQRAACLPELGTLLIADAHLGKAHSFRRLGVPVPAGTTAEMLATLSSLLRSSLARRVVFLGDLLHSARSRSPASWAAVAEWRQGHADVEMTLVRGNHDRHAGDPPADWHIDAVDEPLRFGPLALAHHPDPVAGAYVLAGHVHPAAVLGGKAHDRLRLPCFHLGPAVGVLPAFGGFTGMHVLARSPEDRVFVIAGDSVRALHSLP
jgi:DNA ligase-associated metallophosphoesterase